MMVRNELSEVWRVAFGNSLGCLQACISYRINGALKLEELVTEQVSVENLLLFLCCE
jgi:hypothetical protein